MTWKLVDYASEAAFPQPAHERIDASVIDRFVLPAQWGLTKRELFAAVAMHAEFLSCGSNKEAAEALNDAAQAAGQKIEQRIAINALSVADAMLDELSKTRRESN